VISRAGALVAVAALVGTSALSASGADAAQTHRRAARPATSLALFSSSHGTFRVAKGVSGHRPRHTATLDTHQARALATGISGTGDDGLVCADSGGAYPVHHLRTRPRLGRHLDLSRFNGEGGPTFNFFCDGVSLRGRSAVVTGDSLGVLQLVRRHGAWKVDKRVHSPGHNEAGDPHRPGWIRFPHSLPASEFNNVSIAPRPLHDGKYLAVAFARNLGTMVVVEGVGTPKPRVVGSLTDPLLADGATNFGNGGIVWQPGASRRALVTTRVGFAVLDLKNPSRPRLRSATRVGSSQPSSITVSSDGDHLAIADGDTVLGYGHVKAAVTHGKRFKRETRFRPSTASGEQVTDVAYTANDNLLVLHGVPDVKHWLLTVVTKVPRGHHAVQGSMRTLAPALPGSLSVWPAP
jgi:hypothetical protein